MSDEPVVNDITEQPTQEVVEQSQSAPEQPAEPSPEQPQQAQQRDNGMVPRERLNEVIARVRQLEQIAQQKAWEAEQATQRWQAQQGQQPQQPEHDPATQKFLNLLEQGVNKAVEHRFKALEGRLQRVDGLAEQSESQQFWSQNNQTPNELKDVAESVYQTNKASMPNLTREAALIYAKGLLFEKQQQGALQQAQTSREVMTKVNAQAKAVTTPSAASRAKKFEDLNTADDMEAYLRSEAEKGRIGGS